MNVKQVIVIRRDLKMRRGKEIAQGAHASIMFLSEIVRKALRDGEIPSLTPVEKEWIEGRFTKVCVQVPDEAALLAIREEARKAEISCLMVTDHGLTEFNGVPTNTCLAIGPDEAEKVDAITGKLPLY